MLNVVSYGSKLDDQRDLNTLEMIISTFLDKKAFDNGFTLGTKKITIFRKLKILKMLF
jgi:hypothetical protein